MRKFLALVAFALGALAFAASAVGAKSGIGGTVPLTSGQVHTVCNGKDYCQKSCGLNGEHSCEFGCGSKGCGGTCDDCSSRMSRPQVSHVIHAPVTRMMKSAYSTR